MANVIDVKSKEIAEQEKSLKERIKLQKYGDNLNSIGKILWGVTGGILLFGGMPLVGLAFLSTAAANHLSMKNRSKVENNKLQMLEKEKEHIGKVKNTPIDGSRETTRKRVDKVNELTARKEKVSKERKNAEFASGLSRLVQWVGIAAAMTIPGMWWLPCVGLGARYLSEQKKIEKAAEDDKLALRINNLNLDLELTRAKAPSPRAAGETKCTVVEDAKTKEKSKSSYTSETEKFIDKYVESLDGIGEEENVKQYIK